MKRLIHKCFTSKIDKNPLFIDICREYWKIEKEKSRKNKEILFLNYIIKYSKHSNVIEKIIRLTIPSNLDKENSEEMRMQYKFDSLIQKFIEEHMGFDKKTIKENGDLSLFIMNNFKKKKETQDYSLTINKVYESKEQVINTIGQYSQNERIVIIKELYDKCYERLEAYYISKIFLNRMKLGFGQKSVVSSLNQMKDTINTEDYESLCKILENVFRHNLILNKDNISPGNLVELMLCKSEGCLNDMIDVLKKSKNEYLAETKYDGERTQVIYRIIYRKIHYNGNNVKMYSRNFEDQLTYYPALGNIFENDIIKNDKDVHNFIVDGEICCFSKSTKKFSNFQELRRKVDDTDKDYFIILFDILYMNNHDLSKENIEIRKLNLVKFFSAISKKILVERGTKINFHSNKAVEKIQDLFNKARLVNCEGLVLKETGEKSKYNYGKRQWYKVKSLDEKNCETLDLVPIAGFNGTGKNSNRLSSFVMASYDMQNNRFIAICKLGIGFTEENLDLITKNLMKSALSKPSPNYDIPKNLKPNILFKPTEIWEVGFDSFSVSINYSLGRGLIDETNDSSGLSLRFPRFCRFRPDKKLENSNTPEEIISLFMKFKNYSL